MNTRTNLTTCNVNVLEVQGVLDDEKLVERAMFDLVEEVLELIRPLSASSAIKLLDDLAGVIRKGGMR